MAESVHLVLEGMLPHLEELQHIGLFTDSEIRVIVQKRRHLEYQLFRRPRRKEDFLKAIQYELNLDKLRKLRKERLGMFATSEDAEFGITNRIHGLFKRALKYFKDDVKLWLQHIKYCQRMNQHGLTSQIFGKALAIHPSHVGLWIAAAKFEFEERNNIMSARTLFQQGLRVNPTAQKLWLEFFRMEMLVVDKLRKRKNILSLSMEEEPAVDDVMDYKIPTIVYEEAIKAIPASVEFRLSFLPLLLLFEDTEKQEQDIYDNLQTDFPCSGLMWDGLAMKHWTRVNEDKLNLSEVKALEKRSEQIYREGIEFLHHNEVPNEEILLWEKFLVFLIQRVHYWTGKNSENMKIAVEKMLNVSHEASVKERLTEHVSLQLINLLQTYSLQNAALSLARQCVTLHPSSADIWITRLQCELWSTEFKDIKSMCIEALSCISPESGLQVLQFLINQAVVGKVEKKTLEELFKECLQSSVFSIKEAIGLQYLDWGFATGGIHHIRKIYKFLKTQQPLPVSLYIKIINYEKIQEVPDILKLETLFENALNEHGSTCPDIWLNFIITMMTMGHNVQNVGNLYWRAMKTLDGSFTSEFNIKSQYCFGSYDAIVKGVIITMYERGGPVDT